MKRYTCVVICLLLLAGVAVVLWPFDKTSVGHTVAFSDGTAFTLLNVTYGTQHRLHGISLLERLTSLLPRTVARKLFSTKDLVETGDPALVLWFQRVGKGPPVGYPHLVLCDSTGFEVCARLEIARLGSAGNCVEGCIFDVWPRRQRYFTVRVYESIERWGNDKLVGQFLVRNPVYRTYPTWTPEPLPQTKSQGELSVTMLNLVAGVGDGSNNRRPAVNPIHEVTRADFLIKERGAISSDWRPISVDVSDATGNLIRNIRSWSHEEDVLSAELDPHPWPAESAWELRLGLSRKARFRPDELWKLSLPLSETHVTNEVLIQTNLQGTVLSYTGQQLYSGAQGNRHFHFRIPMEAKRKGYEISLVAATDDQGRPVVLENWAGRFEERIFGLTVETNATAVDLTIALSPTLYFDFRVRPSIIQTNTSKAP